ncbi:MAG TPA: DUF3617 domain-containing protein [Allosphingosinicella sp.]|nr:DUF3617 domain-containing protein [Allosphingosinicella sp.]
MTRFFIIAFLATASGSAAGLDLQAPSRPIAIQPGQWEIATEINTVEAPGAPEAFLQSMRSSLVNQRQTRSQCITPEQARDPTRNLMGNEDPARCDFGETVWTGGDIRVRGTCRPPESSAIQVSVEGTYSAQRFDARLSMNMELPGSGEAGMVQQVHLQGRFTGRRTGDCRSQ